MVHAFTSASSLFWWVSIFCSHWVNSLWIYFFCMSRVLLWFMLGCLVRRLSVAIRLGKTMAGERGNKQPYSNSQRIYFLVWSCHKRNLLWVWIDRISHILHFCWITMGSSLTGLACQLLHGCHSWPCSCIALTVIFLESSTWTLWLIRWMQPGLRYTSGLLLLNAHTIIVLLI